MSPCLRLILFIEPESGRGTMPPVMTVQVVSIRRQDPIMLARCRLLQQADGLTMANLAVSADGMLTIAFQGHDSPDGGLGGDMKEITPSCCLEIYNPILTAPLGTAGISGEGLSDYDGPEKMEIGECGGVRIRTILLCTRFRILDGGQNTNTEFDPY